VCEWEGSYAYSSLVGGLLCLLLNRGRVLTPISRHNFPPILRGVGIISVPISRSEIDGYRVPSTYTTNFLS